MKKNYNFKDKVYVGNVFGIPVYIGLSFLFLVFTLTAIFFFINQSFFIFVLGFGYINNFYLRFILSFLTAISLSVIVFIHELFHAIVAKKFGISVKEIVLTFIGGYTSLKTRVEQPRVEFAIAMVGPMSTTIIGGACFALCLIFNLFFNMFFYISIFFSVVGFYSLFLGALNFLPSFPLDGGAILRSSLTARHNYANATIITANVSYIFMISIAIVGFVILNLIFLLFAFIIWIGTSQEKTNAITSFLIKNVRVKDVMNTNLALASELTTIKEFLQLSIKHGYFGCAIVNVHNNSIQKFVTINDAIKVHSSKRDAMLVRDLIVQPSFIKEDELLLNAMAVIGEQQKDTLFVTRGNEVIGTLSRSDVLRILQLRDVAMRTSDSKYVDITTNY